MGSRASLNKVLLIGNLTRDPELRYTPSGAAVCSFGIATNRFYTASDGEKKEETEFVKIVSWNKLAELCSQLLSKGRKVYVEGRLQTRSWETPDGQSKQTTEVVIDDMRILDSRREAYGEEYVAPGADLSKSMASKPEPIEEPIAADSAKIEEVKEKDEKSSFAKASSVVKTMEDESEDKEEKKPSKPKTVAEDEVNLDDLPF